MIASVIQFIPSIVTALAVFALCLWATVTCSNRHMMVAVGKTPQAHVEQPIAQSAAREPALPPNATFAFKGRPFYVIKHHYTRDENIELRAALRDLHECIAHNFEPITATYDGPIIRFTRNWVSVIRENGRTRTIEMLGEIDGKLIYGNVQLMEILGKRPYFRYDLQSLILNAPMVSDLRGAIHEFQEALKSVPDNSAQDLIKLSLGEKEKKIEAAADAHRSWIGQVYNKINLVRDELETLATLD